MNPVRNVQLTVALFGELISSTGTIRRLLVVPINIKIKKKIIVFLGG